MTTSIKKLKIGSRGSPLALKQVEMVKAALAEVMPNLETETVVITTSGDWKPEHGETRLSADKGGKGLFAKEIERALLDGEIDCAVHSMKDMETDMPEGLVIEHMLPREDVRDVLIVGDRSLDIKNINDIPEGFVIGTASVRREAILKSLRPDLKFVPIRGNVETRIKKCREGQVDAILLAYAGLKRMGLEHEITCILDSDQVVSSAGQGAVGIQVKNSDENTLAIFGQISCNITVKRVFAERAVLEMVDGSCHTPIGVLTTFEGDLLHVKAQIWSLDGMRTFSETGSGVVRTPQEAVALGREVGEALKNKTPDDILSFVINEGA